MQIFTNTHYDFIKWRWHAIALSLVIIVAGAVLIGQRGLPLGIDFSGGTIVVYKFERPVSEEQVRTAIAKVPGEKVVQQYGTKEDRSISVRLPQQPGARLLEVAELLRHVDPGVVGVGVEVESEAERLRFARHVLALLPAGGKAEGGDEQGDGESGCRGSGALHLLLSIAK